MGGAVCRVPWQGKPDFLVSRYDAVNQLDVLTEPPADTPEHPEEIELKEPLQFERYRDLLVATVRGCTARTAPSAVVMRVETHIACIGGWLGVVDEDAHLSLIEVDDEARQEQARRVALAQDRARGTPCLAVDVRGGVLTRAVCPVGSGGDGGQVATATAAAPTGRCRDRVPLRGQRRHRGQSARERVRLLAAGPRAKSAGTQGLMGCCCV